MKENIAIGCFVILFVFVIWSTWGDNSFKDSHTSETEAVITSMGTGCGASHSVIKFSYSVNKTKLENWTCYSNTLRMESKFKVGMIAKACYDPAKPDDASVIPIDYECRKPQNR